MEFGCGDREISAQHFFYQGQGHEETHHSRLHGRGLRLRYGGFCLHETGSLGTWDRTALWGEVVDSAMYTGWREQQHLIHSFYANLKMCFPVCPILSDILRLFVYDF